MQLGFIMAQQTTTRRNTAKTNIKLARPFWTKFAAVVFLLGGLIGFVALKNVQNPPSVIMINAAKEMSSTEHTDRIDDLEMKVLNMQQQILSLDKNLHEFRREPKCKMSPKEQSCK